MNILIKAKRLKSQCGTYAIARMLQRAGVPLFIARHVLAVQK